MHSRWGHRWARLTLAAAFVAITSGALVTTLHIGMADPVWPTAPWHLFVISWEEPKPGYLIEHGHRLADYTVGFCIIIVNIALWRTEKRSWVRRLAALALAGVIIQGLLGGMRVLLNALQGPGLAWAHGAFGQIIFALLAALVVVTDRPKEDEPVVKEIPALNRFRLAAFVYVVLTYLQLVLGGLIRHFNSRTGARGHLLLAFAVVAGLTWLWHAGREIDSRGLGIRSLLIGLLTLTAVQICLGLEAWMIRFASGKLFELQEVTVAQAFIRTAHFACGSLLLALGTAVAIRTEWCLSMVQQRAAMPAGSAS